MLVPWAIFWKADILKPVIEVNHTSFCFSEIETAIIIVAYSCLWKVFTSYHNCTLCTGPKEHQILLIPDKHSV